MSDPYLNKIPPQNIEAEESLISSILLDREEFEKIINILDPEDFYKNAHKKIYESSVDLYEKGDPVDLVTVANKLNEDGFLEDVGGASYLSTIIDSTPMAANAVYYAEIIRDKAILRDLIRGANKLTERCFEDKGDIDEIIQGVEDGILKASERKKNKKARSTKDIFLKTYEIIEKNKNSKGDISGIRTGFFDLDYMLSGLQPSDLFILGARPSMGKTSMALNIAEEILNFTDKTVCIFSLEMTAEQLAMRLISQKTFINSHSLRSGNFADTDWNKIAGASSDLSSKQLVIDDEVYDTKGMRSRLRGLAKENELGLFIIDYLQMLKKPKADRNDLSIEENVRQIKLMCKEFNIPCIALSQLNRELEKRNDKRPIMADLRDSGAIEQYADIVGFIYREIVYNPDFEDPEKAELIIRKHRNGEIGTIELKFIKNITKFVGRV